MVSKFCFGGASIGLLGRIVGIVFLLNEVNGLPFISFQEVLLVDAVFVNPKRYS